MHYLLKYFEFAAAIARADCWLKKEENFNELLAIAKTRLPVAELSDSKFADMIRQDVPTFSPVMSASDFKTWNDMLLRAKILKEAVPAELTRWSTIPSAEPKC